MSSKRFPITLTKVEYAAINAIEACRKLAMAMDRHTAAIEELRVSTSALNLCRLAEVDSSAKLTDARKTESDNGKEYVTTFVSPYELHRSY